MDRDRGQRGLGISRPRRAIGANFRRHFGFKRIGVHHQRLAPGRRLSFPHAESADEELVYLLEGTPDAGPDGRLHRLAAGDAVGFPAGTGLAHTFINTTEDEVRLLVVGERTKPDNCVFYPLNPDSETAIPNWWDEAPRRELGLHDSLPDKLRSARASGRRSE